MAFSSFEEDDDDRFGAGGFGSGFGGGAGTGAGAGAGRGGLPAQDILHELRRRADDGRRHGRRGGRTADFVAAARQQSMKQTSPVETQSRVFRSSC